MRKTHTSINMKGQVMIDANANKRLLWQGAVFGGLVAGVMSAKNQTFGWTRFWEETAYVCDGLDGREGTIFFQGGWRSGLGWAFGLFFDPKSQFSPFNCAEYSLDKFITGMPLAQRDSAEEVVGSFMSDEINGVSVPLVTSAFWNADEDRIVASLPWEEVLCGGVDLICKEFRGFNPKSL